MFDRLRRRGGAPSRPAPGRPKASAPPRPAQGASADPAALPPSPALPEVVGEGNTQADWSAWEDSVATLDSQLQDLLPSHSVYVRDTRPSQLEEDPFASVRGKRDV